MEGLHVIAEIVEKGDSGEALIAISTVFPHLIDPDAQTSPIDNITQASKLANELGLPWSRAVNGVIGVYDKWNTGRREVYHPLYEVLVTEDMPEPRALTLACLRAAPHSRNYLIKSQENS